MPLPRVTTSSIMRCKQKQDEIVSWFNIDGLGGT